MQTIIVKTAAFFGFSEEKSSISLRLPEIAITHRLSRTFVRFLICEMGARRMKKKATKPRKQPSPEPAT